MTKSLKSILTVFACVLIAGGVFTATQQISAQEKQHPNIVENIPETAPSVIKVPPPLEVVELQTDEIGILKQDGETLYFNVELAVTQPQQARGLMYRTEMGDNEGMLFLFNSNTMRSFWMKNTLIPLDILFLNFDGTIHHIHHNAKPQDLTSITSKYPSKAALEVNGGTADKMGIKEGDQIIHAFFNNIGVQNP